ncbi:uncharacterized protein B0I36DRAFT_384461 [Microdochium trichocladiopsis]|uniref:Uncharacterized protein n=1 Tax=Microdochium trichocladiopsis TaxID=1682393 RepID=A0A9P9BP18_9PEZI|nr:uncharacterized protein B0I36DRAFT_384461 [Microdochium trichocladiopsis]KAH7028797.1 hypothetical protein B0I36DRAFT_384461 [Microdochium trichocladiopsis]
MSSAADRTDMCAQRVSSPWRSQPPKQKEGYIERAFGASHCPIFGAVFVAPEDAVELAIQYDALTIVMALLDGSGWEAQGNSRQPLAPMSTNRRQVTLHHFTSPQSTASLKRTHTSLSVPAPAPGGENQNTKRHKCSTSKDVPDRAGKGPEHEDPATCNNDNTSNAPFLEHIDGEGGCCLGDHEGTPRCDHDANDDDETEESDDGSNNGSDDEYDSEEDDGEEADAMPLIAEVLHELEQNDDKYEGNDHDNIEPEDTNPGTLGISTEKRDPPAQLTNNMKARLEQKYPLTDHLQDTRPLTEDGERFVRMFTDLVCNYHELVLGILATSLRGNPNGQQEIAPTIWGVIRAWDPKRLARMIIAGIPREIQELGGKSDVSLSDLLRSSCKLPFREHRWGAYMDVLAALDVAQDPELYIGTSTNGNGGISTRVRRYHILHHFGHRQQFKKIGKDSHEGQIVAGRAPHVLALVLFEPSQPGAGLLARMAELFMCMFWGTLPEKPSCALDRPGSNGCGKSDFSEVGPLSRWPAIRPGIHESLRKLSRQASQELSKD